ncbi:MAG: flagellar hook protein FlgE [Armatimonadota bacterium]
MIQAMYNGVSGLRAHKTQMDVISNNIANINTIGFKSSRVNFREMFNQTIKGATAPKAGGVGGVNPAQIGLGTSIGSIDISQIQGSLQPTGKSTDVAIEGNGYLILGDGVGKYYTRDGSFMLDGDGNLVSAGSGMKVLGWMADQSTGVIDSTQPVSAASSLRLPVGQLAIARQTTSVTYGGNINASAEAGDSYSVSAQAYDSLGVAHPLSVTFTKLQVPMITQGYANTTTTVGSGVVSITVGTDTPVAVNMAAGDDLQDLCDAINASGADVTASIANDGPVGSEYSLVLESTNGKQVTVASTLAGGAVTPTFSFDSTQDGRWDWEASSADAASGSTVGSGVLAFDPMGKSTVAEGDVSLTLARSNGATNPIAAKLSFSPITQLKGDTTVSTLTQNGLPLGMLDSFTIGKDGTISGSFTNGMNQALGQIALAQFSNPSGLSKAGNNVLVETSNSGLPQIGQPSVGSLGKITAGFLESSNVDLPTEFTNMIVAQRGFQANSRIITTSDDILQELVQLKR